MKKHMKTERKKNLERSYCHINLKEHKIISRKYYVQGLTVYLVFMLSRLLSRCSLNKEWESLHSSGFHCWKLHLLHQDVTETLRVSLSKVTQLSQLYLPTRMIWASTVHSRLV